MTKSKAFGKHGKQLELKGTNFPQTLIPSDYHHIFFEKMKWGIFPDQQTKHFKRIGLIKIRLLGQIQDLLYSIR